MLPEVPLKIRLLGEFALERADEALTTVYTPRLQALLAYLLLHRDAPQSRQRLAFLLWPDTSEAQAYNNLRVLLHTLRRSLPDSNLLYADRTTVRWQPGAALRLDVAEFEAALGRAAQCERAGHRAGVLAALAEAADGYGGDLLPGCYDDWILPERENLRNRYGDALERLIRLLEEDEQYRPAILYAQRLLQHDPLREPAYAALLRLYLATGDRVSAIRTYETCAAVLREEMGDEPGPEIAALQARALRSDPGRPMELPPSLGTSRGLPIPLTSFIGRSREIAATIEALAKARLVTLTGPGGSGKTRLALEIARTLERGRTATGADIRWIELAGLAPAPLTDPRNMADLVQAVAAGLGLVELQGASGDQVAGLSAALCERELLLVLDNCEHVLPACAGLVRALLSTCPSLRILTTSRESLGLTGEYLLVVPSLALPAAVTGVDAGGALGAAEYGFSAEGSAAHLLQYDAVRLFVERAMTVWPTFELNARNAAAVAAICQRLDGMPLAIELAAARVRLLAPELIARRLEDALALLTRGDRGAAPRQRTLRATLDWSYALLAEPEQVLLARLAPFAGGFTLAAAESLCAGGSLDRGDVMDLLAALVDKSLVAVVDADVGDAARYRLLETIRQYAAEKLRETPEHERVWRGYFAFFQALAREGAPELRGRRQAEWLNLLEAEHDNLRAALGWALARPDLAEEALAMGADLFAFWRLRGHFNEGRRWLTRALENAPPDPLSPARARALYGLGILAWLQLDLDAARANMTASLACFRALADEPGLAFATEGMGMVAWMDNNAPEAQSAFAAAREMFARLGERWGCAEAAHHLGALALSQGELANAYAHLAEALAGFTALGDGQRCALMQRVLGEVAFRQGDRAASRDLLASALRGSQALGSPLEVARTLETIGVYALNVGDWEQSMRLLAAALGLNRSLGVLAEPEEGETAEDLRTLRANLSEAAYAAGWAAGQSLAPAEAIAEAVAYLGTGNG